MPCSGVIVLAVMLYLSSKTDSMFPEVLDIISWVAIWEAVTIVVIEKHDLRRERWNYRKLSEAKITIENRSV